MRGAESREQRTADTAGRRTRSEAKNCTNNNHSKEIGKSEIIRVAIRFRYNIISDRYRYFPIYRSYRYRHN
jgi:hypothetical protein